MKSIPLFAMRSCYALILAGLSIVTAFGLPGLTSLAQENDLSETIKVISPQTIGYAEFNVERILASETGGKLMKIITKDREFAEVLAKLKSSMDVEIQSLKSVSIVVMTQEIPSPFDPRFGGPGPRQNPIAIVAIVETKTKLDRGKVLRWRFSDIVAPSMTPNRDFRQNIAMQFLDEKRIVLGEPTSLLRFADLLSADADGLPLPLPSLFKNSDENSLVRIAGYLPKHLSNELVMDAPFGTEPSVVAMLYPMINQPSSVTVSANPDLKIDFHFIRKNEMSARLAAESFKAGAELIGTGIDGLLADKTANFGSKDVKEVVVRFRNSLKKVKVENTGTTATVSMNLKMDVLALNGAFQLMTKKVQISTAQSVTRNSLKQILLGMHIFHDTKGGMPPSYIVGKNKRPLLSWRVAILPYIEQDNLFNRFRIDEPWDSPNNKRLIPLMPKIYASPLDPKSAQSGKTYFQVITGKGAAFEIPRNLKPGLQGGIVLPSFTDGSSNTIGVVEAANPVIWTKPDDLEYDAKKPLPKFGGLFPDGFFAASCDGAVHFISHKADEQSLRAAITRNGGEIFSFDLLSEPKR